MDENRHLHADCLLSPALEAALATDAVDDIDWEYVSPDGLAVREAFALATTWSTRLKRVFGLPKTEWPLELVDNAQWLSVTNRASSNSDDEEGMSEAMATAKMARASVLLWQALATCRGFTIKENVKFWSCVFDHVHCAPLPFVFDNDLWDRASLFDGVPFPRCKLTNIHTTVYGAAADRFVRVFAGLESENDLDGSVMQELEAALAKLAPFVRVELLEPVEIMIDFPRKELDAEGASRLLDTISAIENAHTGLARIECSTVMKHLLAQPLPVQVHVLQCLCAVVQDRALPVLGSLNIPQDSYRFAMESHADRLQFMAHARCFLGLNASCGGARRLHFVFDHQPKCMAGVCAGLPVSKYVTRLNILCPFQFKQVSSVDLAWLAYALFHPDSAVSKWRALDLYRLRYAPLDLFATSTDPLNQWGASDVLTMMATGNNLRVIMCLTTETTDRYFTALLQAGAVIYATSTISDAIVMAIEREDTEMDVCVTTTDVAAVDEWVMVVVPGFGVGYVESRFVKSITARLPGRAFLTHMVVKWVDFATPLIELAGGEVEFMEYQQSGEDRLDVVKASCPNLVAYHLYCNNQSGLPDWVPPVTLRELKVSLYRARHPQLRERLAMFQSLKHLETLVISTDDSPFVEDIEGFVLPVLRSLRQLKRFHWVSENTSSEQAKATSAQKRAISRLMIRGLVKGKDDVAITRPPVAAIVALLSVVNSYAKGAIPLAISLIDRDAVALIGSFMGTVVERDLYIQARRRWIYEEQPL